MKKIIVFLILVVVAISLNAQAIYRMPKVLFVTSGDGAGRGTVSDGVVMALQAFNKAGAFVRLENKSVLLRSEDLAKYDILILPTIKSYHDTPKNEALTCLSRTEMKNIANWTKNGGTLIAGENIGRNLPDGTDRALQGGVLNAENWELAECFGVEMQEINAGDFHFTGNGTGIWKNDIMQPYKKNAWRLVPVKTAENTKVLMYQKNVIESYPALILNDYGKGHAVLLPTFRLLHPRHDGGLSENYEIEAFYKYVFELSTGNRKHQLFLSPWKDGFTTAYCQTFDDGGTVQQYRTTIDFIEKNKLPTVFFVTPNIDKEAMDLLKNEPFIALEGHSFTHPDFRTLDFEQTQSEFLHNADFWQKKFKGFRFPYVSNSFWGMFLLEKYGFVYETSIAANHLEYIRGSVVPYNIPVFNEEFYLTLDLLEISQMYYSDWYFYQKVLEEKPYLPEEQKKDAERFKKYLFRYYHEVVKPNNGVFVYLGHPMYTAISEITKQPLEDLIAYLRSENVWITSLNTVAERWNALKDLQVEVTDGKNKVKMEFSAKQPIPGLSVRLDKLPVKVTGCDSYEMKKTKDGLFFVFDLEGDMEVDFKF